MIRGLFLAVFALLLTGAREPVLVPDVSQRNVDIVYSFTGAELLLFGAILYPDGRFPQRDADIAVVLKGPSQPILMREKQRLLGTIRDRLAGGGSVRHLTLAVAGWMRYAAGVDERGAKIEVNDPMAGRLAHAAASAHGDPVRLARSFLAIREIFGDDLAARQAFVDDVSRQLAALIERGSRATVEAHLAAA